MKAQGKKALEEGIHAKALASQRVWWGRWKGAQAAAHQGAERKVVGGELGA